MVCCEFGLNVLEVPPFNSVGFQMTSTKFPNTPKPILGACSDGFPKPFAWSGSESSEVICFNEPLLAFQSNNQPVNEQASRQVNQSVSNLKPQFQPAVTREVTQSVFDMHDPWNVDVNTVESSMMSRASASFPDPPFVKVPTLLKVGEDPYDPWNLHVCDVEPCNQPIPHFGGDLEPKQTVGQPNLEPSNLPVLLKAGEDIHDPWNVHEQLNGFYNFQQRISQSSSCSHVDPRNAL